MARLTCVVALLGGMCLSAAADMTPAEAAKTFDEMFGAELKRVAGTRDSADDLTLAKALMGMVREESTKPAMAGRLCHAVYDLCAPLADGGDLAMDAMRQCAEVAPEQRADCQEKILLLLRKAYAKARGDARVRVGAVLLDAMTEAAESMVAAARYTDALRTLRQATAVASSIRSARRNRILYEIRRVTALDRTRKQVSVLEAKLKDDPSDEAAATRLVELYLIELDQPDKALEYLRPDADESLRTYIPLAVKAPADLAEQVCMELGTWYHGLSEKGGVTGKPLMLRRARTYLERFLELHQGTDLVATKAKLLLEKIEADLAKLEPPEPLGRWVDVLRLIDPDKHTVSGRWTRRGTMLATARAFGPPTSSRVLIPVKPKGDYEIRVKFNRTDGDSSVDLILPVGTKGVVLALSRSGGQVSGLCDIKGKDCGENDTKKPGRLTNDKVHTVTAKVSVRGDDAHIEATLDDSKLVDWKGPVSDLACPESWSLPDKEALGLGVYRMTTVVFTAAHMRMLSGRVTNSTYTRPRPRNPWDRRDGDRRFPGRFPGRPGGRPGRGR